MSGFPFLKAPPNLSKVYQVPGILFRSNQRVTLRPEKDSLSKIYDGYSCGKEGACARTAIF